MNAFMEKAGISQIGRIIRGYCLEKFLRNEMTTWIYHARTEELWLPADMLIRLFPLPETWPAPVQAEFFTRFEREARSLIRLRHSSLFPLYGYGRQDHMAYLLMPALQGETLEVHLQRQHRWTPGEAYALLAQLAAALDMLHRQGLAHQFLCPAQIFLGEDRRAQITGLRLAQMVCLRDLGLSAAAEQDPEGPVHLRALDGSYLGAAEYLAPEVVKGLPADARADVYSLGVLLFELLSGQPPFSGNDYLATACKHLLEIPPALHELVPDLPVALEIVVNRALHRDPQYRFQTAGEMVAACSDALQKRVRPFTFSLQAQLRVQRQALPARENQARLAAPKLLAGPDPACQEPETTATKDKQPSSPEEVVADAWLNTPPETASAGTTRAISPRDTRSEVPTEMTRTRTGTRQPPVAGTPESSPQTGDSPAQIDWPVLAGPVTQAPADTSITQDFYEFAFAELTNEARRFVSPDQPRSDDSPTPPVPV